MGEQIICVREDLYAGLYNKIEYFLIRDGIPTYFPGFSLIKKAVVLRKIYGKVSPEVLVVLLKASGIVIPFRKERDKKREDALEWMTEALVAADIISEYEEEPEDHVISYIEEIAGKV